MKKLSEEQRKAIVAELAKCGFTEKGADDRLREAGLLTPAETPYEKARRLWEELYAPYDAWYVNAIKDDVIDPLFAEIDRRDCEVWSDQDMISFGSFCCGKALNGEDVDMKEELAARRAAKAKE